MTPEQHAQVPEEEDVTAADRLIIEFAEHGGTDRIAGTGARDRTYGHGAQARWPAQIAASNRCNSLLS